MFQVLFSPQAHWRLALIYVYEVRHRHVTCLLLKDDQKRVCHFWAETSLIADARLSNSPFPSFDNHRGIQRDGKVLRWWSFSLPGSCDTLIRRMSPVNQHFTSRFLISRYQETHFYCCKPLRFAVGCYLAYLDWSTL